MHGSNTRGLKDEEQFNIVAQEVQDLKNNTTRINVRATEVQQEKVCNKSVTRTSAHAIKA
jgi:hypothetical protein